MHDIDYELISDLIVDVSEKKILPRYGNLSEQDVQNKSLTAEDYVTIADKETEQTLIRNISKLYPNAQFIGEESSHKNPKELDKLNSDFPVWIIDPLDGTANFKDGTHNFGVILSYIYKGEVLFGWIYNPVTKMMVVAEHGSGAWCDGKKLSVATVSNIRQANAIFSLQFFSDKHAAILKEKAGKLLNWQNNFGSVAIDYQRVVSEKFHFALFNFLRVWDHAAGILIHKEAGGYSAKFDGTQYQTTDNQGGLLLAPSKELWELFDREILSYIGRTQ